MLYCAVDEEFEAVASQVLMRTQSMVNKYRRLLMVEAEVCLPQCTQCTNPTITIFRIYPLFYFRELVLLGTSLSKIRSTT